MVEPLQLVFPQPLQSCHLSPLFLSFRIGFQPVRNLLFGVFQQRFRDCCNHDWILLGWGMDWKLPGCRSVSSPHRRSEAGLNLG